MSIFVSNDTLETDLRHGGEVDSGSLFLDLPLRDDLDEGTEVRYFDAHSSDTEVVSIVPVVLAPACPSHLHRQGPAGWGPRVRRRRAPRAVFEAAPSSRTQSTFHGTWRGLVALVVLAALPLGGALGYYLNPAPPVAVLSPELLDFGTVDLGKTVERKATLENRGEQVLKVVEVTLIAGAEAEFALLAEGCRGAVLEPEMSCPLRLVFRPRFEGSRRAEVVLRSNAVDGLRVLPLLGEGR